MHDLLARRHFPELTELESLIKGFGPLARVKLLREVHHKDKSFPILSVTIGSEDPLAPALGVFAGAHGLEKIGSEVALAYMRNVLQLLRWDQSFRNRLQVSKIVFVPILNPVGIMWRTRSNGNGVDLIRNSPLNAEESGGGIYRGHRLSPKLPWYRGPEGAEIEAETQALFDAVKSEMFSSKVSLAIDIHSGFGTRDRFWFPYAHSKRPFPHLPEAFSLKEIFDQSYPYHFYDFEPMSRQYTIHGDPWDYLYEEHRQKSQGIFIPFTLEMGSWTWLKKNPLQIFKKAGVFDPMLPHRRRRILRRHLTLFDFLHRVLISHSQWSELSEQEREEQLSKAMELWYVK